MTYKVRYVRAQAIALSFVGPAIYSSSTKYAAVDAFLILGIFCTALFIAAISVYIFHDVDQDKIGHWIEAFAGLRAESVLFTLMVGGPVWLLTLLGRRLFHLRDYSPRAMLGLFLGTGVTMFQYPWEFAARNLFSKLVDSALSFYLVVAIVLCTVVLLRDNFGQMKLHKAREAESQRVESGGSSPDLTRKPFMWGPGLVSRLHRQVDRDATISSAGKEGPCNRFVAW